LSIVEIAARDEKVFAKFRANRQYRKILEHVTKSLALEYLGLIPQDERHLLSSLIRCDTVGGPLRCRFRNYGRYSPTTIRYLYFFTQYQKYFGDLANFKVIEIGGGFGGQAAVSLTLNPGVSWTIFDLPEVLALQEKYLYSTNPDAKIEFQSGLEISKTHGDLLISNYALSEISRELQLKYIELVVSNCPKGYMAWNTISEKDGGGLTLSEVLELIPGSTYIDEVPRSSPGNVIVYWGV
jgi:putative sugar O-methyltransferase